MSASSLRPCLICDSSACPATQSATSQRPSPTAAAAWTARAAPEAPARSMVASSRGCSARALATVIEGLNQPSAREGAM